MKTPSAQLLKWFGTAGLVYAYFVAFPGDLKLVLGPLDTVLRLSTAVSPWLFVLASAGTVSWTAVRLWGSKGEKKP